MEFEKKTMEVVMIHKYRLNGYNIVLDVHSGGVHVVDDLTYAMLNYITPPLEEQAPQSFYSDYFSDYSVEEIDECYEELYKLYHNGLLFSEDDYEQFSRQMVSSPIKAMCLHVAHDCNLRCLSLIHIWANFRPPPGRLILSPPNRLLPEGRRRSRLRRRE